MDVRLRRGDVATRHAGALALGILEGTTTLTGAAAAVDRATRGAIRTLLRRGDFTGRFLETAVAEGTEREPRRFGVDSHVAHHGSAGVCRKDRAHVSAAVVEHHQFSVRVGLPGEAADGAGNKGAAVGGDHDAAHERRRDGPPCECRNHGALWSPRAVALQPGGLVAPESGVQAAPESLPQGGLRDNIEESA